MRQGEAGRSLFVVRTGDVRVEKADGGGSPRELARLGPGSFFGEMSLLTGEPRSASVVAVGEVEVVVVEKDAFSTLLHDDGHLARALSEALEERTREQARVETLTAGPVGPQVMTDGLLDRIQRFFGLED